MVSQHNPIRIFVSHHWEADDDYQRVFEFLENSRNFYYVNSSKPERRPPGGKEAEREELRQQIAPAEAVILLASHHRRSPELIEFQANFAKAADKPVILLTSFGGTGAISKALLSLADESVDWDERALTAALRRQARHEETARWDTIEFKLD
jgi:hypothetical protein